MQQILDPSLRQSDERQFFSGGLLTLDRYVPQPLRLVMFSLLIFASDMKPGDLFVGVSLPFVRRKLR
jgi:hypothetical protein